tara:strand:+ start:1740 stop:1883 length:144 start_codon:yes stop_codon:yes gene_type:complete
MQYLHYPFRIFLQFKADYKIIGISDEVRFATYPRLRFFLKPQVEGVM